MKRLRAYIKQAVALFILTAFISTQGYAVPAPAGLAQMEVNSSKTLPSDLSSVKLSEENGRIQENFKGHKNQTVILIQDAHAVPDAQKNIQKIIAHFQKEYGVNFIALEGAASELDPQIFRSFPDQKLLADTFEEYWQKGEITGTTGAAIFNPIPAVYEGVEDWDSYEKGLRLYQQAMAQKKKVQDLLRIEFKKLNAQKEQVYSRQLLEVDKSFENFHQNKQDLIETLETLARFRKPQKGSEIALLLAAAVDEKKEANLSLELKRIADGAHVEFKISPEFNEKYQAYQTSRLSVGEFALYLKEKTSQSFSASLQKLIERQKKMRDIEGTQLFQDLELYEQAVKQTLFQNKREKQLDRESSRLWRLDRLSRLELNREDWKSIQNSELGNFAEFLKPFIAFYKIAEERDGIFFKNLLALMKKHNSKQSIFVAGGFHAESLIQKFKEEGISYLLITPQIGTLPEISHYQEQMRGDVSWKNYYQVENGKVSLYKAFVRGMRDRLLGFEVGRSKFETFASDLKPRTSNFLLKKWRDKIIQDLAHQEKISKAGDYTPFFDEVVTGKAGALPEWRAKIEKFIENLRGLEAHGKFTQQNVFNLFKPSTHASPAYASVVPGTLLDARDLSIEVQEGWPIAKSELRTDQNFSPASSYESLERATQELYEKNQADGHRIDRRAVREYAEQLRTLYLQYHRNHPQNSEAGLESLSRLEQRDFSDDKSLVSFLIILLLGSTGTSEKYAFKAIASDLLHFYLENADQEEDDRVIEWIKIALELRQSPDRFNFENMDEVKIQGLSEEENEGMVRMLTDRFNSGVGNTRHNLIELLGSKHSPKRLALLKSLLRDAAITYFYLIGDKRYNKGYAESVFNGIFWKKELGEITKESPRLYPRIYWDRTLIYQLHDVIRKLSVGGYRDSGSFEAVLSKDIEEWTLGDLALLLENLALTIEEAPADDGSSRAYHFKDGRYSYKLEFGQIGDYVRIARFLLGSDDPQSTLRMYKDENPDLYRRVSDRLRSELRTHAEAELGGGRLKRVSTVTHHVERAEEGKDLPSEVRKINLKDRYGKIRVVNVKPWFIFEMLFTGSSRDTLKKIAKQELARFDQAEQGVWETKNPNELEASLEHWRNLLDETYDGPPRLLLIPADKMPDEPEIVSYGAYKLGDNVSAVMSNQDRQTGNIKKLDDVGGQEYVRLSFGSLVRVPVEIDGRQYYLLHGNLKKIRKGVLQYQPYGGHALFTDDSKLRQDLIRRFGIILQNPKDPREMAFYLPRSRLEEFLNLYRAEIAAGSELYFMNPLAVMLMELAEEFTGFKADGSQIEDGLPIFSDPGIFELRSEQRSDIEPFEFDPRTEGHRNSLRDALKEMYRKHGGNRLRVLRQGDIAFSILDSEFNFKDPNNSYVLAQDREINRIAREMREVMPDPLGVLADALDEENYSVITPSVAEQYLRVARFFIHGINFELKKNQRPFVSALREYAAFILNNNVRGRDVDLFLHLYDELIMFGLRSNLRVHRALTRLNISDLKELIERNPARFYLLRNFGEKSLMSILKTLAFYGLSLKGEDYRRFLSISELRSESQLADASQSGETPEQRRAEIIQRILEPVSDGAFRNLSSEEARDELNLFHSTLWNPEKAVGMADLFSSQHVESHEMYYPQEPVQMEFKLRNGSTLTITSLSRGGKIEDSTELRTHIFRVDGEIVGYMLYRRIPEIDAPASVLLGFNIFTPYRGKNSDEIFQASLKMIYHLYERKGVRIERFITPKAIFKDRVNPQGGEPIGNRYQSAKFYLGQGFFPHERRSMANEALQKRISNEAVSNAELDGLINDVSFWELPLPKTSVPSSGISAAVDPSRLVNKIIDIWLGMVVVSFFITGITPIAVFLAALLGATSVFIRWGVIPFQEKRNRQSSVRSELRTESNRGGDSENEQTWRTRIVEFFLQTESGIFILGVLLLSIIVFLITPFTNPVNITTNAPIRGEGQAGIKIQEKENPPVFPDEELAFKINQFSVEDKILKADYEASAARKNKSFIFKIKVFYDEVIGEIIPDKVSVTANVETADGQRPMTLADFKEFKGIVEGDSKKRDARLNLPPGESIKTYHEMIKIAGGEPKLFERVEKQAKLQPRSELRTYASGRKTHPFFSGSSRTIVQRLEDIKIPEIPLKVTSVRILRVIFLMLGLVVFVGMFHLNSGPAQQKNIPANKVKGLAAPPARSELRGKAKPDILAEAVRAWLIHRSIEGYSDDKVIQQLVGPKTRKSSLKKLIPMGADLRVLLTELKELIKDVEVIKGFLEAGESYASPDKAGQLLIFLRRQLSLDNNKKQTAEKQFTIEEQQELVQLLALKKEGAEQVFEKLRQWESGEAVPNQSYVEKLIKFYENKYQALDIEKALKGKIREWMRKAFPAVPKKSKRLTRTEKIRILLENRRAEIVQLGDVTDVAVAKILFKAAPMGGSVKSYTAFFRKKTNADLVMDFKIRLTNQGEVFDPFAHKRAELRVNAEQNDILSRAELRETAAKVVDFYQGSRHEMEMKDAKVIVQAGTNEFVSMLKRAMAEKDQAVSQAAWGYTRSIRDIRENFLLQHDISEAELKRMTPGEIEELIDVVTGAVRLNKHVQINLKVPVIYLTKFQRLLGRSTNQDDAMTWKSEEGIFQIHHVDAANISSVPNLSITAEPFNPATDTLESDLTDMGTAIEPGKLSQMVAAGLAAKAALSERTHRTILRPDSLHPKVFRVSASEMSALELFTGWLAANTATASSA